MRLIQLEIENVRRVKALSVDANGNHVMIDGENGSGKTSAVTALEVGLRGGSVKNFVAPIHHGALKATVRIDLGEYRVERSWTATGMKLDVYNADGIRQPNGQDILNGLLSKHSSDPASFLDIQPKERIASVLAVCQIIPPVEKVEALAGEKLPARPGESADVYLDRIGGKDGAFYIRRHEVGQRLTSKQATLTERRAQLTKLGGAVAGEPKSMTDLVAKLQALNQQATERVEARQILEDVERQQQEATNLLAGLRDDAATLRQQISELQLKLTATEARILRGDEHCQKMLANVEETRRLYEQTKDPSPEIAAIQQQIKTIEQDNKSVQDRQRVAAEVQTLESEVKALAAEHQKYEQVIKEVRDMQLHLLDNLDLGVEGMAIADGDIWINGVPWPAVSESDQVRAACAIGYRQNPKLRMIRMDHGERFSKKTRDLVFKFADEHDMQVVMTRVSDSAELRVEIVDAHPQPAAQAAPAMEVADEPAGAING